MTNLEKYLAELLADSVGCGVHKMRMGTGKCVTSCEVCIRENLEWLNAECMEEPKTCGDCKTIYKLIGEDGIVYCKHYDALQDANMRACEYFIQGEFCADGERKE